MPRILYILRHIKKARKQSVIFVLCVALSLLTLVSLGSFSDSVRQSMLRDARQLHAADIKIHSHQPFSRKLVEQVTNYQKAGTVDKALVHQFYSMARNPLSEKSLFCQLKVVEKGYPFYGTVQLTSNRIFSAALKPGAVVVEQAVLDRLQALPGDSISIGSSSFTITDIVISEPDRPVSFFSFGPRIFIAAEDLEKLDLIQKGSRIHHNLLLKVHNSKNIETIAEKLTQAAIPRQENVKTYKTAESGVKRFFENFLFFLNLIGIFTLLLAGIGIQTALQALLRESDHSIAIMKSTGATRRFVASYFSIMIILLGSIGTFFGLGLSFLLQLYFPTLFAGILPTNMNLTLSWKAVAEGLCLGCVVVALFSYTPLRLINSIKPAFIFRKEVSKTNRSAGDYCALIITIIFFTALAVWQLEDVKTGFYFVTAILGLVGFSALISKILLISLKNAKPHSLALRQALKGLFRPKNATFAIILTLTSSLAVIFSIYQIEKNLNATFIENYPEDLPNVYFVDIQTSQKKAFQTILENDIVTDLQFYPIIRARLSSINQRPINQTAERKRKRDNLAREFNLTYRHFLLDDEIMLQGNNLFDGQSEASKKNNEVPVSVLDTVAEIGNIKVGDLLIFKVQGIPLKARVTSLRGRTASKVRPFFYFVFPKEVLYKAPQTIFSAARIDRSRLLPIQNKLAAQLANVSVIDIGKNIEVLARIMHKLSSIIQFFTSFSIIAGLLIIISSVFATRLDRIREAVYFKIFGAKSLFIFKVLLYENLLMGLTCALLAALVSQGGSWIICKYVFDISYTVFPMSMLISTVSTVLLIIGIGVSASATVMQQKPINFLRHEEE